VAAWLDPALAQRLHAGSIASLADLMSRITQRGFRLHVTVPQLGVVRAVRLVLWLTAYGTTLGARQYAHAQCHAETGGFFSVCEMWRHTKVRGEARARR
jgi:hypothetical protein